MAQTLTPAKESNDIRVVNPTQIELWLQAERLKEMSEENQQVFYKQFPEVRKAVSSRGQENGVGHYNLDLPHGKIGRFRNFFTVGKRKDQQYTEGLNGSKVFLDFPYIFSKVEGIHIVPDYKTIERYLEIKGKVVKKSVEELLDSTLGLNGSTEVIRVNMVDRISSEDNKDNGYWRGFEDESFKAYDLVKPKGRSLLVYKLGKQ